MRRALLTLVTIALLATNAARAAQIAITASQLSINGVDSLTGENPNSPYSAEGGRLETKLVNGGIITGTPRTQANGDVNTDYWNAHYTLSPTTGTSGTQGLLIDLGAVYQLGAIQLFGYNTTADPSVQKRSLASFTLWTATSTSAVEIVSSQLVVNDVGGLALFAQQGGTQSMGAVTNTPTQGDTYLFGGSGKPSVLGGTDHIVTASAVSARYLFFRNMTSFPGADASVIGLGEVQVFEFQEVPEPSSAVILLSGSVVMCVVRRFRRQG